MNNSLIKGGSQWCNLPFSLLRIIFLFVANNLSRCCDLLRLFIQSVLPFVAICFSLWYEQSFSLMWFASLIYAICPSLRSDLFFSLIWTIFLVDVICFSYLCSQPFPLILPVLLFVLNDILFKIIKKTFKHATNLI